MKRKFLAVAMLVPFVLYSSGCPTAQQWFQIAAGLVPIVLQTVSSLQVAGGGLSPNAQTALATFSNDATTILNDVAADIGIVQTNVGIVLKIDALLKQLQAQSQALLPQFSGNTQVSAWISAILADTIDLMNLVPVIQQATGATPAARPRIVATKVSLPTAQSYQSIFKHRLNVVQAAA
jgi:hypothetical protein